MPQHRVVVGALLLDDLEALGLVEPDRAVGAFYAEADTPDATDCSSSNLLPQQSAPDPSSPPSWEDRHGQLRDIFGQIGKSRFFWCEESQPHRTYRFFANDRDDPLIRWARPALDVSSELACR